MASSLCRRAGSLLCMDFRPSLPLACVLSRKLFFPRDYLKIINFRVLMFISTADPKKEPTVEIMNAVLPAIALDYPPNKLPLYLSDDGGSSLNLFGMMEAWKFARSWLPFCREYGIKTICPKAYFSDQEDDCTDSGSAESIIQWQNMKEKYMVFEEGVTKAKEEKMLDDEDIIISSQHHPSVVEGITLLSSTWFSATQVSSELVAEPCRESHGTPEKSLKWKLTISSFR